MNNKTIGCKSLVEKELFKKGEGREFARKDLLIKVAKIMDKEGISKYKVTEIDIHENYGLDRTEKVQLDKHGDIYLQEYVIYKCFAKVEYRLKGELLK